MFSTKRYAAVLSSLLMCLAASHAAAADRPAKIDAAACEKPEFPTRWQIEGDRGDVLVAFLVGTDGKVMDYLFGFQMTQDQLKYNATR